jgi:hypothetical protein
MNTLKKCHHSFIHQILAIILVTACCASCRLDSGQADHSLVSVRTEKTENGDEVPLENAVKYLLNSCASDFQKHHVSRPVKFRNMKIGYIMKADSTKQYMLCGEFLPEDKKEVEGWVPFATIRTMDFEQWIGDQSIPFCEDKNVVWEKAGNLSEKLIAKLTEE